MGSTVFMDNAKVMSKGQVTIPKSVRDVLGIECGDNVTFIVEGQNVRVQLSTQCKCLAIICKEKLKKLELNLQMMLTNWSGPSDLVMK